MRKLLISIILFTFFYCNYTQSQDVIIPVPEIKVQYDFYNQCKLGTAFKTLDNGYLLKIRLLLNNDEHGEILIKLWEYDGSRNILLSGPYVWNIPSGNSGWQEFEFPYAIPLIKNKTYLISIGSNTNSNSTGRTSILNEKSNGNGRIVKEQSPDNLGSAILSNWYIVNSPRINVIVSLRLTPGVIGNDQTICYNSIPEPLKHVIPPSGGTGTYIYQWQSSPDTISWTSISGANLASYSPPSLRSSVWYRRLVSSGNDKDLKSNPILISVNPVLSAGTIGTSQTVCNNTIPAAIKQINPPSGGSGSFLYQWQSSSDNTTWTDIPGANQNEYTPPGSTENKWYRRNVISGACGIVYSNTVAVTVIPALTAGTIAADQSVCYSTIPASLIQLTTASGGTGIYNYQWQISTDNLNWTNISGANSVTYSPPALNISTWYRRNISSGNCEIKSSNSVNITVYPDLAAGTIGTGQTICYNTAPTSLTQLTAASGGTGTYSYQWQSSADNNSWSDIPNANQASYSPPVLTSGRWYRRNITSGSCETEHSNSLRIIVNANLTAGTIGATQSVCYNNTPAALTQITPASGGTGSYTYQWQTSSDNINWSNISGGNSTTYSPPSLTTNTWYRRDVTSGNCGTVTSNIISITVYPNLNAGSVGVDQTICYNSAPAALVQTAAPSGGSGVYSFQWQSSANNTSWTNISNANLANYSPPSLTLSSWFRRNVTSGCTQSSNSVRIDLYPRVNSAQLHDDKTIYENTSTTFDVTISGGTPPYTIRYRVNGINQPAVANYVSGTDLSTGVLTAGTYSYSLTSAPDANGCNAQGLGTNIVITVISEQSTLTSKALIVVNSSSSSYSEYVTYIKPYLDNFGIPYDVCNINSNVLPSLSDYAVIIFGHKNVYSSGYPIAQLESAVSSGSGLYSLDPHLFDYSSGFNTLITQRSATSSQINISNYSHYITQYHAPDSYSPNNNLVNLISSWNVVQKSNLVGGVDLATMSSVSLLQVSNYGNGRVVKWSGYDWMFEGTLGPVYGMDDLIWRGIVWAARKPFVMQGLPPMITMRVDDVDAGGDLQYDFEWIKISNEFGFIPWCGVFTNWILPYTVPTLKTLIDNNKATASPHAFGSGFMYFNHDNLPSFDAAANTRMGRDFFIQNGLKISKYIVPHYYEVSSEALPEIRAMGGEFLGIHMLPNNLYYQSGLAWLNCGPYRINRYGNAVNTRPVYYGGYVNLSGIDFFICLTEIRDDGGYEWHPDNDVTSTSARGIRHLRRSLNSMVLSALFTHEYYFEQITIASWREILRQVTTSISEYSPEYRSMDYAVQYIRAKSNMRITNVTEDLNNIEISYTGNNDMNTKCYLFTEQNGQITYRFVVLPSVNGSNRITTPR